MEGLRKTSAGPSARSAALPFLEDVLDVIEHRARQGRLIVEVALVEGPPIVARLHDARGVGVEPHLVGLRANAEGVDDRVLEDALGPLVLGVEARLLLATFEGDAG